MLSIILAILIFGLLIFIHEAGHYLFARLFNVKIYEFAIGMGPKLVSYTSKKTDIKYSLRLLPFGGFVSMAGEDEESEDENAINKKPVWQRLIITAAGAAVNLVVGALVMTLLVSLGSAGLYSTQIDGFYEIEGHTSSSEQGLKLHDIILEVDGTGVHTGNDVHYEIMRKGIEPVELTVLRDGERVTVSGVEFTTISESGTAFGIKDFSLAKEEKSVGNALKHGLFRSVSSIKMVYDSLYDLITGRYGVDSMSGPVGVTKVLGEAAEEGAENFIYLAAFLSINLGVMNLLPLPALDGGRIFFQLIELIFRRPVPAKIEGIIHFVGIALLMLLLVVITFKDIIGLFG